ncbi:MAG: serine/threonine-protein kinase [Gemmataceae bacterium]
MKPNAEPTVETVCELLAASPLLTAAEVAELRQRWDREATDPTDVQAFNGWLEDRRYLSDFQLSMVLQRHANLLVLNEYKLIDRVGRGRLTMVYKAVDRVGQPAALKVLPPSRARDKATLAWFLREAQLGRQLDHHNLVCPKVAGEANGVHYLIMDFLEETLQSVLDRRGRLPPQEAVELTVQALEGLAYLHARKLVLRNLEPANLMLVMPAPGTLPPDVVPQPTVKILDFSFCRLPNEKPTDGRGRGKGLEGNPLASPAYLAPEQARDAAKADIRSDIYSLGCILYHALAGRPPFVDADPAKQMGMHLTATPPPLLALNPEVPEGLALIVGWMTARDPAQRYQTPDQAATALRAFLATLTPVVDVEPAAEATVELVEAAGAAPTDRPRARKPVPPPPPARPRLPDLPPPEVLRVDSTPEIRVPANVELVGTLETSRDCETLSAAPMFDEAVTPAPPGVAPSELAFSAAPAAARLRRGRDRSQRREMVYLLLGGLGVLAVQAVAWALGQVFARRRGDSSHRDK